MNFFFYLLIITIIPYQICLGGADQNNTMQLETELHSVNTNDDEGDIFNGVTLEKPNRLAPTDKDSITDTISQTKLDNEFQDKAALAGDLREHSLRSQNSLGSFSNGKWYESSNNDHNSQHLDSTALTKAKLIALNKITAHSKEIIINNSSPQFFGNLQIILHKCVRVNNPYKPDNQALLTLIDHKPDEYANIVFRGWMLSSTMSLCNFENPIYEIFIKECL